MQKEVLNNEQSTMQIEVNKTHIKWLIGQAREMKEELDMINSRLLGILIAMVLGAFGFIGTLLITLLKVG